MILYPTFAVSKERFFEWDFSAIYVEDLQPFLSKWTHVVHYNILDNIKRK